MRPGACCPTSTGCTLSRSTRSSRDARCGVYPTPSPAHSRGWILFRNLKRRQSWANSSTSCWPDRNRFPFAGSACEREHLGLRPRQSRLPQVIGKVRRSSEQYSKSIPVRFPLEILFRNRGMPLPPIRGRELRKTLPQLLVDFLPCGFERLSRDRQRNGLVRARDEHAAEFGMKTFSNPDQL